MRALTLLLLAGAAAFGAEEVVLQTGFRMSAERTESLGDVLRIYTAGGTVDIPKGQVAAIEAIAEVAPPISAAAPAVRPEPPAPPLAAKGPKEHLADAAASTGLPPEFLLSIARVESAFQPGAVSPKGAIGVMQLMPGTAKAWNVDPHDMRQNIEGGARLMRELLLKYEKYPDQVYRALSAYNAGEGAVARFNGIPPYRETQQYVVKVLNEYNRLKSANSAVSR